MISFNATSCVFIILFYLRTIATLDFNQKLEEGPEDGFLNFTQLARKYGRGCEEIEVITEDGYILTMFHLKGDENYPVLMWHGLLDSGDGYILRGENSTAIELNEAGYDVWVANTRGCKYSRRHVSLDPDHDKEYWKFSIHEVAIYDLTACIDLVLKRTGQSKLAALGHSMGNMIYYILGSTKPEYNDKVKVLIALGPVAYLSHVRELARVYPVLWPVISAALSVTTTGEVLSDQSKFHEFLEVVCSNSTLGYDVCVRIVAGSIFGHDSAELEPEFVDVVIRHFPAGTSRRVLDHFAQIMIRDKFSSFDYGILNLNKYGSLTPPDYDLSKVTMPIALLCGRSDTLATIKDVAKLRAELANVVLYKVMDRKEFNHIDFLYARDVSTYNGYYISILEANDSK